ncbi:hypothetical protein BCL57_002574 [Agromyces flavus]|uniref:Uncharacterized protein n=1 Tax=Agromyces flavus TaxID=589382 RepID=A0A1H1TL26_9MICO|nr:hypothetical protein [Agromyces flavus]MCP2368401.1 hypothetical protein [Agromyces flavus]GGI47861.1 hypothetical protein GCM10010932_25490 [Agromyces flavus]SDS60937.1 hypothetical protein SAMN04489721_1600 [Agromyces flavus]
MADLSRYLPLSRRPDVDESGVTADRRAETAEVLGGVAKLIRTGGDALWSTSTARAGWHVADVVAELVHGFDRTRTRRALDAAERLVRGGEARRLAELPKLAGPAEAVDAIDARTRGIRERTRPTSVAELDDAVVAALLVGGAASVDPPMSPVASGAVALRRAAAAPTEIRAVIAGHTLRATDAGWEFGHGSPLVDTAAGLLRFLTGIGTVAPHPPGPGDAPPPATGSRAG